MLKHKIILKKRINDNEYKYSTVYFNALLKTVINRIYHLNDAFQKILNLLDISINETSAWIKLMDYTLTHVIMNYY